MEYMAIMAIVGAIISSITLLGQQDKEYNMQKDLLSDEQKFQAEREDIAWNRSRPNQIYSDYLDVGFNPNLAAQSVLGGSAETAQTSGSPSAPPVNSAIGALQSMFGQSTQNVVDSFMKQAQIENLNANTDKTNVETGIMPRDFALRQLSTIQQLKVWDKSVEKMSSEIGYNKEMTDLVKQQNLYYGRLSESELKVREAQVNEAISQAMLNLEKIDTEKFQQQNLSADTALKRAETSNVVQDTANKIIEGSLTYEQSERERIAKEFEAAIGGVPLTADAQKMVNKWALEGDYNRIREFYTTIFQSSLNQTLGNAYGTPTKISSGLPFNIFQKDRYEFGKWSNFQNAPVWRPYEVWQ